ncbi:MAG: nucleotidyltransferase family protein [Myxococcota bacterium]
MNPRAASSLLSAWLREALAPACSPDLSGKLLQARGAAKARSVGAPWPAIFQRAHAQGIAPLLHASLDRWGLLEVLAREATPFGNARGATLRQNILYLAELGRITEALSAAGVRAVLLKGAAFLGDLYDHPGDRPMSDLDLLVTPLEVAAALRILESLGYAPLRPGLGAALLRTNHEIEFARRLPDGTVLYVELHWRLIPAESLVAGPAREPAVFRERSRPCAGAGVRADVLSPEDALVFSAIHLQRHAYSRAIWFVDLALLIRRHPIDWRAVVHAARAWEAGPAAFVALSGARSLCGAAVPATVMKSLHPGRGRAAVFDAILPWHRMFGAQSAMGEHALPPTRRYLLKLLQARDTLAALRRIAGMIFPSEQWLRARYGFRSPGLPPGIRRRHLLRAGRAALGRGAGAGSLQHLKPAAGAE